MQLFGACGIEAIGTSCLKSCDKFIQVAGLPCGIVVPRVKHLQESPLSPTVELWIASLDASAPIKTETYLFKLLAITFDVLPGCYLGMLTRLDSVLFCRQAICVETHGMENVETVQTFISGVYVAGNVT